MTRIHPPDTHHAGVGEAEESGGRGHTRQASHGSCQREEFGTSYIKLSTHFIKTSLECSFPVTVGEVNVTSELLKKYLHLHLRVAMLSPILPAPCAECAVKESD